MDTDLQQNLSPDPETQRDPLYQRVISVLDSMARTGVLFAARGNCIAISEMLSHLLTDQGIKNHMLECQLLVTRDNPVGLDFTFVGYNNGTKQGGISIDTHVVVIVQGRRPLLVDLSIQHLLPQGRLWLCEALNKGQDPEYIMQTRLDTTNFVYTQKRRIRLPEIHQKSMIERMEDDRRTKQRITAIQVILTVACVITVINFVLNSLQVWMRVDHIQELKQEVNQLEQLLKDKK